MKLKWKALAMSALVAATCTVSTLAVGDSNIEPRAGQGYISGTIPNTSYSGNGVLKYVSTGKIQASTTSSKNTASVTAKVSSAKLKNPATGTTKTVSASTTYGTGSVAATATAGSTYTQVVSASGYHTASFGGNSWSGGTYLP